MMIMMITIMSIIIDDDNDHDDDDDTFDEGGVHEFSVDLDPTAQEGGIKRPVVVVPEQSSYLIIHCSVNSV